MSLPLCVCKCECEGLKRFDLHQDSDALCLGCNGPLLGNDGGGGGGGGGGGQNGC